MNSTTGFGAAWWLVAGLYACLAAGCRDPWAFGAAATLAAVSVGMAVRPRWRKARRRAY